MEVPVMTANISDYIRWRGDLPLTMDSLTEADAIVLCEISYLNFGIFHADQTSTADTEAAISSAPVLHDLLLTAEGSFHLPDGAVTAPIDKEESMRFLESAARSIRFGALPLLNIREVLDEGKNTQFGAVTFLLPDGSRYIAFRGTDNTVVGWKEDFMISYTRTEAQDLALAYVRKALEQPGSIRVGGHSKGANLALFAAAFLTAEERTRLSGLDLLDGPGLCPEVLGNETDSNLTGLQAITHRLIPSYSVIGKLFESDITPAVIVKSNAKGILQHDLLSWQIAYGQPEQADCNDPGSMFLNRSFEQWIEHADMEERQHFVEVLFNSMTDSGYQTIDQITAGGPAAFENIVLRFLMTSHRALGTGMRLPLTMFFGNAWSQLAEAIRGHESARWAEIVPCILFILLGFVLMIIPDTALRWLPGLAIFSAAIFEGILTISELRAEKRSGQTELNGWKTRFMLTIILAAAAVVISVKENALYVLGSSLFGIASLWLGANGILNRRRTPGPLSPGIVLSAIFLIAGAGILIAPVNAGSGFSSGLGGLFLIHGLISLFRILFSNHVAMIRDFVNRIPFVTMYQTDSNFRINLMLIASSLLSAVFMAVHLIPGLLDHSIWMITVGSLDAAFMLIRLTLYFDNRRNLQLHDISLSETHRKARRRTGRLIIIIAIIFSASSVLTILQGQAYIYSGSMIYLIALITLIRWILLFTSTLRERKRTEFPVRENICIRLCTTLNSVYALQTAMLTHFSESPALSPLHADIITGSFISLIMLAAGIWCLVTSRRTSS